MKFIKPIILFFRGNSFLKNLVVSILVLGIFVTCFLLCNNANWPDSVLAVINTVLGVALTTYLLYLLKIFIDLFEDPLKVSTNYRELLKIYKGDQNYRKVVSLNNTEKSFIYNEVIQNINNDFTFEVCDNPNDIFHYNEFIGQYYLDLISSHSSSKFDNCKTIRMCDFEKVGDKSYKFTLGRSNFFAHMVTNRAVDYNLGNNLTLRRQFEYGPFIKPLKESQFSNHVGINGLVFLEDEYLFLPIRKANSTISKKCVTSSIATRLTFPSGNEDLPITKEYLLRDNIIQNLKNRLFIDITLLKQENIDIKFLGFGQNIYEGGKPQMYFSVVLKGVNKHNYKKFIKKPYKNHTIIDKDSKIKLVDFSTFKFAKLSAKIKCKISKKRTQKNSIFNRRYRYEDSFILNIWHYQQNKKRTLVMMDSFGVVFKTLLPTWFKERFGDEYKPICDKYCKLADEGKLSAFEVAQDIILNYSKYLKHSEKTPKKLFKTWVKRAEVIDGMKELIPLIRKNNALVLASNSAYDLVGRVLYKNGLYRKFDGLYISSRLKKTKPSLDFYNHIVSNLRRDFDSIYMIDDNIKNLEPLEGTKIKPIHFESVSQLKEKLEELKII